MRLSTIINIVLVLLLAGAGYRQVTTYLRNQDYEGRPLPPFKVPVLGAGLFDSTALERPLVVVFWATWCGPCQVELTRINSMIEDGEIGPEAVLAISSFEEASVVAKAVKERNYRFPVGLDVSGGVAQSFGVAGTPTIVFIGQDKSIQWMTTGISPLLGFRIRRFLN